MSFELQVLEGEPLGDAWVRKPFIAVEGFRSSWWLEQAKGPLRFFVLTDTDLGQVARAQVSPTSFSGAAYPTWSGPESGAAEIDLLEVRADLHGRGLGATTVDQIQAALGVPLIAISLNTASDAFWRSLGWTEHLHQDTEGSADDDSTSLLFAGPTDHLVRTNA
ncbi:hypothetical protein [Nocardioides sp.]|uniref:hypothetical protein n=1 Tax=Nocardioides sp. TaxID=35761 RepID=UPI00271AE659|nr:hypothetical protein [Nocardioides sp.]MDO9455246.1 hypothetical protein [Nocardioides sp.]